MKQKGGTAWVDGDNALGVVVGNFCTDLAMELAQECGIGWVVANNSNHYGICAHYAKRMADKGLVVVFFISRDQYPMSSGNVLHQHVAVPLSIRLRRNGPRQQPDLRGN